MSESKVSWIFLGTALLALGWGIWLKVNEPEPVEPGQAPEKEWLRIDGELVERGTLKPFQGVRAIPFDGAPGMVQWEYTYVDGVRQGAAIEYYPSPDKKVKSRSTYVDGTMQGPVINYHSNGIVKSKAIAVDGWLEGLVTFYKEDGTVLERDVYQQSAPAGVSAITAEPELVAEAKEDGGAEGAGDEGSGDAAVEASPLMLSADGQAFTGMQLGTYVGGAKAFEHGYQNGREHGAHHGWEADGQPEYERSYLDGGRHGVWKQWAENGELVSESSFHHGLQIGTAMTWFPNGQPRQVSQFVHGAEHGVRSNHDAAGRKRRETIFDHGIQISRKDWSTRGELTRDESTPFAEGLALSLEPGAEPVVRSIPITRFPADLEGGLVIGLRYRISSEDPDPAPGVARAFRISVVHNASPLGFSDFAGELGGWRTHQWVVYLEAGDALEIRLEAGAGVLRIDLDGIGFVDEATEQERPEESDLLEAPDAADAPE